MRSTYRHSAIQFWTLGKSIGILVFAIIGIYITGLSHADEPVRPKTDYSEVVAAINVTMRAHHYNSAKLDTPEISRREKV